MARILSMAAVAAFAFSAAAPLASSARAEMEVVNIPVPKAVIATAFNAAFASTKAHVHNLGSKHGSGSGISWHADASHLLLPNGKKSSFAVDEQVFNVSKWRQLKYYVDDLNTQSIQATIDGGRINVDLRFENKGEEIKAKCIRRRLKKWEECSLDIERDIHIDNAMLGVSLEPIAYKGSIAYANINQDQDVTFKYDIKIANKLCQTFKGICGWIEGKIKNKLTPAIESAAVANLNQTAVKDKIASAIRNSATLGGLVKPSWKITKVTSSGSNFILRVERSVTKSASLD
ncbi:hypothetical protein [Sinorhizobium saheli]|uniref:Uncharacterized protein n=1 Tax=Sinorhizobium saheli TaxID=36856 RepID=A0A178YPB8_SINSA|nr:hypothetical protein [Sinorhizobium saheli]MQW86893.1 hypothetical protein [Sinorhizobium saheli]OAP49267.1 hypothetical protein ATB98_24785 [Sinorhizobium saheli]